MSVQNSKYNSIQEPNILAWLYMVEETGDRLAAEILQQETLRYQQELSRRNRAKLTSAYEQARQNDRETQVDWE